MQPKTAVILHVNDTFGQGIIKGVDVLWERLQVPIKIVDRISYDVRARDLSVEVAKAKSSGADLLMPITRVSDAILMIREMVKQNWSPMGIISPGSPGPYEKAFTDALGKYADGYMSCVPWYNPTKKRAREIADRFERETGDRFDLNAAFAFEAVEIAADAIKRANSAQPGRHSRRAQGHRYQRSHHLWRPDPFRREGPESQYRRRDAAEPEWQTRCRRPAGRGRGQGRVPACAIRQAVTSLYLNVISGGILIGVVYALIALGLTIIFGVMRLVNFAHGEMVVIGMYAGYAMWSATGLPPWTLAPVAALLLFAMGYLLQKAIINAYIDRPQHAQFILFIALALIITGLHLVLFGPDPRPIQIVESMQSYAIGPIRLDVVRTQAALMALGFIGLLMLFFDTPRSGRRSEPLPII